MKKGLLLIVAVFIALVMAMPAPAATKAKGKTDGEIKLGIIDLQKIMRDSKAAKSAQALFRKDVDAKRSVLAAKEKEIRVMEEELKGAGAKMTEEDRRHKAEKLAREVRELKLTSGDMEEELKRKDRELSQKIVMEVMKVVTAHAKKENYTLIFERSSVMAMDEAIDITDTIMKLYDAGK